MARVLHLHTRNTCIHTYIRKLHLDFVFVSRSGNEIYIWYINRKNICTLAKIFIKIRLRRTFVYFQISINNIPVIYRTDFVPSLKRTDGSIFSYIIYNYTKLKKNTYVQNNSRVSEAKDQKYSFGTYIYTYIYIRVPPGTINHNVYFASSPPMSPRCQLRSMLMHRPETILISSWKLWNVNASEKKSNSYFSLSCLSTTRIRFFSLPNFLSLSFSLPTGRYDLRTD